MDDGPAALALEGVLVSGDGMVVQRQLSIQIAEGGGDDCWIVKKNQKTLDDDLRLLFGPQPDDLPGTSAIPDDVVSVCTVDKTHGRLEVRVMTTSELLAEYHGWPYVAQAFQVVCASETGRCCTREVRYGITSVPQAVASSALRVELVPDTTARTRPPPASDPILLSQMCCCCVQLIRLLSSPILVQLRQMVRCCRSHRCSRLQPSWQ
jgi:hypothetical protein